MKIKKILSQYRRDFQAEYECGHCGATHKGSGYDDAYFHNTVIPDMVCKKCNKKDEPEEYRPLATKYDDSVTV